MSRLVATPAWKSAWVVSVRQALGGAAVNEKFCVVVPPSVTTMDEAEAGPNPGLPAVIDGYVPAGVPGEEEITEPSVVVERPAPNWTVAPGIGAPPGLTVTVPETVPPAPTGTQPGNAGIEPNLVSQR